MSMHNITVDLNDSSIITEGSWMKSVSGDGKPLLLTTAPNATVIFTFDGSFISVAGSLGSNVTNSTINLVYTLDGYGNLTYTPGSISGILYTSSDLTSDRHTLRMTLNSNTSQLSVQSVTIAEEPSRLDISALVGGVIGGIVFLLLVISLLLLYRRRCIQKSNTARQSLQLNPLNSQKHENYRLSFTPSPSPSTDTFTSTPSRKHSLRSPQPDFTLIRTMNNVPTVNFDDII